MPNVISKIQRHARRTCVAIICPKHGFIKGGHCIECVKARPKQSLGIITHNWIKTTEFEHIDPAQPHMRFNTKKEQILACEKRGLYPKAFMKPKSRGKGWEAK